MPRPRNKEDLVIATTMNYEKLLYEWHLLLLEWIKNRENGNSKPFLNNEQSL